MLDREQLAELKETVKNQLLSTGRASIADLVDWLETETDYFTAPAGARYHGTFEGGLLKHSFTVLLRLGELVVHFGFAPDYKYDTLAICALLHDVCKTNCYHLIDGKYKFDEDDYYGGHGCKSVFLIQRFIRLSPDEIKAINAHMGAYENSSYHDAGKVFSECPLAWLLHVADEAATYIDKI